MSEQLIQALQRLVVGGAIAAIAFIVANISILADQIHDPLYSGTIVTIAVAVLNFIAKWLGGPTSATATLSGEAFSARTGTKRPNILAV